MNEGTFRIYMHEDEWHVIHLGRHEGVTRLYIENAVHNTTAIAPIAPAQMRALAAALLAEADSQEKS